MDDLDWFRVAPCMDPPICFDCHWAMVAPAAYPHERWPWWIPENDLQLPAPQDSSMTRGKTWLLNVYFTKSQHCQLFICFTKDLMILIILINSRVLFEQKSHRPFDTVWPRRPAEQNALALRLDMAGSSGGGSWAVPGGFGSSSTREDDWSIIFSSFFPSFITCQKFRFFQCTMAIPVYPHFQIQWNDQLWGYIGIQ